MGAAGLKRSSGVAGANLPVLGAWPVELAWGLASALSYCRREHWEIERFGPVLEVLSAPSSHRESQCIAGGLCSEAIAQSVRTAGSPRPSTLIGQETDSERPASASKPHRQRETALGCTSTLVSSPQNRLPSLALYPSLHWARRHCLQHNVDSHHGTLVFLGFLVFLKGSGITIHN